MPWDIRKAGNRKTVVVFPMYFLSLCFQNFTDLLSDTTNEWMVSYLGCAFYPTCDWGEPNYCASNPRHHSFLNEGMLLVRNLCIHPSRRNRGSLRISEHHKGISNTRSQFENNLSSPASDGANKGCRARPALDSRDPDSKGVKHSPLHFAELSAWTNG